MKKIILCCSVILFAFSFSAHAGKGSCNKLTLEDMLSGYFEECSLSKGTLENVDKKSNLLGVNGNVYELEKTVNIYFPLSEKGEEPVLKVGQNVIYDLNDEGKIASIWGLPESSSGTVKKIQEGLLSWTRIK